MISKIPFDNDDEFEQFESEHHVENTGNNQISDIIKLTEKDWRQKIRTRAITYLARREYSRIELRKKIISSLRGFEYKPEGSFEKDSLDVIDEILDDLARQNWQSDQRVAASIAKVKGERYGSARVKYELNQQGLDSELVAEQLDQLASTELKRAHEVWLKKFGNTPTDLKEKAKQIRFMASRGFSFEIINKIIKNVDDCLFDET